MALEGVKLLCDGASIGDAKELASLVSDLAATDCSFEDMKEGTQPDVLITSSVLSEAYKVLTCVIAATYFAVHFTL